MGEEVRIAKQVRVCVVVRLCKFSTCEIAPAHTDRRTGQPVPASLPAAIAAGTFLSFDSLRSPQSGLLSAVCLAPLGCGSNNPNPNPPQAA